jgi:hypothetical protein
MFSFLTKGFPLAPNSTIVSVRLFSSSTVLYLLQNHKMFPKVDWERVDAGNYAVVDPVNPGVILYLSEQDYIVMVRVAITSNKTLKVLASPGELQPTTSSSTSSQDPSQNSPNLDPFETVLKLGRRSSDGRKGKARYLNLFRSKLQEFFAPVKATMSTKVGAAGISMIGLSGRNIEKWFHTWHDIVAWWSRGSKLTTVQKNERSSFAVYLKTILENNGVNHLIARLKIMLFVVNAYLGGRRLTTTSELGFRIRLQNGLPSCLPRIVRDGIRFGNKHYIHIWSSMLFSYKGILGTWVEPDLSKGSITNPHPDIANTDAFLGYFKFCAHFWAVLRQSGLKNEIKPNLKIKGTFFSTHAGPNHGITVLGAGIDAYLWESLDRFGFVQAHGVGSPVPTDGRVPTVDSIWAAQAVRWIAGVDSNYIREWLQLTGQSEIWELIRRTGKMFRINHLVLNHVKSANDEFAYLGRNDPASPWFVDNKNHYSKSNQERLGNLNRINDYLSKFFGMNTRGYRFETPTLQRLHNLYEAAGKVRTIAIVDYWTNFVLKPLHDWMFDILDFLPQDATFDQEGRVKEFSMRGYTDVYSFDLKSATDLIPLALYRALFRNVLPEEVLEKWFDLLVKRQFLIPKSTLKAFPSSPRRIRYSTGQPMGALTSWASMALVHHALVLYSAVLAGVVTSQNVLSFIDYMVLGDDVVIANSKVAEAYARLMRELCVPLSMSKSHISEVGMFNFANQTFVKEVNVSPVSLREEINATSLPERVEMTLRMARRGWMDLGSRTWVTPLIKKMVGQDVWHHLSTEISVRVVPPVIRWILATMLTPGTTRYEFAGLKSITLEIFLGAMLRKTDLWAFSMGRFGDLIDRRRGRGILVSILGKWVSAVYRSFLHSRKRLEEFLPWVTKVVSVDLEWLFKRIFEDAKADALARWTTKYRMPLKEIEISTKLSNFSIEDVEAGTGRAWADLVTFVHEAEGKLPLVPDFSQENIDALTGLQTEGSAETAYQTARASFMRVTNILGMVDHLGLSGTPGFLEAWDFSQSNEYSIDFREAIASANFIEKELRK